MAVDIRRIFRVVGSMSLLNAGQIGVQENVDADLGWRMHGGKDDLGVPTQWLAKDRPAQVTALTMNEAQFLGVEGILRHNTAGGVIGGQMTVAEFNSYLSDGPISGGGDTPGIYQDLGSSGVLSGGAITDSGGQLFAVALGEGLFRETASHLGALSKHSWAASTGLTIPDGQARYIFASYNAGSPVVVSKSSFSHDHTTELFLGSVVREGTTLHVSNNPDTVSNAISRLNERFRHNDPLWVEGLGLGETGTRNVTVSAGEVYYKLNETQLAAFDSSGTDTFDVYLGATLDTAGATQWDNLNYNNGGVKTAVTNNRFGCLWFYRETDGGTVCVYGSSNSSTEAGAEAEGPPTVLPLRIQTHGFLVGRIIFEQGASTATDIESAVDGEFSGTPVTDHNFLSGLNVGDYQHLTAANHTALTGGGSTSLHTHPAASHNLLTGLNVGDYQHLTAANHTALTTGVQTSLHKHSYLAIQDTPSGRIPFGTGTAAPLSSSSAFLWDNSNDRITARRLVLSTNPGSLGTLYGCHLAAAGSAALGDATYTADLYSSGIDQYPSFNFRFSRTNTLGNHAMPGNTQVLGRVGFWGSDGTSAFARTAGIMASASEAWASTDRGTRLQFVTTPRGGTTSNITLDLLDGHAYVYDSVIAGQSHTFSGSYGAMFGSNNTNAMDYSVVSGRYAKAEWDHGHYQAGFRLDGSTVGGSQSFGPITIGRRFTVGGAADILTPEGGGESPPIYTTFTLEQGYAYLFEVVLSAAFVGSSQSGWDSKTYLIRAYRDATTGDVEGVSFTETGNLAGTGVTGSITCGADNSFYGIDIRWIPSALCSASDPIDVVARVVGVKHKIVNND